MFKKVEAGILLQGGMMKTKAFGTKAKLGIILLIFAFALVPICAGSAFADEQAASAGAAETGETGAGAAGAGAAGAGGTTGVSTMSMVGILGALALTAALVAASASGDDGAGTTAHH
jgi:hypothetical protein